MPLPIARGRISHTLRSEVRWFLASTVGRLSDEELIREAENEFAAYLRRRQCVVFPFARTAIWSILKDLDLPKGSRVVMPPITIKPILDVVVHLGYEPVFVDIDPSTACFDEMELAEVVKTRPAVAILTYLFGLVPNVERIVQLLRQSRVFIIEDFSQCLNGEFNGKRIGTFGDVSVYSASSVKTFDTFGGGFALSDNPEILDRLRRRQAELSSPRRSSLLRSIGRNLLRNVASSRLVFAFATYPALRLASRFSGRAVGRFTGARSTEPLRSLPDEWFRRYTSMQARVALRELPKVAARDERRREYIEEIVSSVGDIDRPTGVHGQGHVYWQFIIYVGDFQKSRRVLASHQIDCATTSLVLLTDLSQYPGQRETRWAKRLYELGVYLPCYHQLRQSEVSRISAALREMTAAT